MNNRIKLLIVSLAALMSVWGRAAFALDWPPGDGKPLSEIVAMVERLEAGRIYEAEFDDGLWEVKIRKGNQFQKIYFAPRSGEEVRRKRVKPDETPPSGAMALSAIIRSVEAQNLGVITEAEFEDDFWEVKIYSKREKIKLYINPLSGETVRQKRKARKLPSS